MADVWQLHVTFLIHVKYVDYFTSNMILLSKQSDCFSNPFLLGVTCLTYYFIMYGFYFHELGCRFLESLCTAFLSIGLTPFWHFHIESTLLVHLTYVFEQNKLAHQLWRSTTNCRAQGICDESEMPKFMRERPFFLFSSVLLCIVHLAN